MVDWRSLPRPECAASFVHEPGSSPELRRGLRANGARGCTPRRQALFVETPARSWVFSRSNVNRTEIEEIGVRIVAFDLKHLGDEPASGPPCDLDDDV